MHARECPSRPARGVHGSLTRRSVLRSFLHRGGLYLAGAAAGGTWLASRALSSPDTTRPALKIGLVTDVHYADKKAAGTRHYRESLPRLERGVARLNELGADFAVEIGDLVDAAATVEEEIGYLVRIEKAYRAFKGPRHYVLGNHCVHTLTKREFLRHSGAKKNFYSFDHGDLHFVVLDACFRADGVSYGRMNFKWSDTEIPPAERRWLARDLARTDRKTLVFVHQRIDLEPTASSYAVKSAAAVRRILERSGKVVAVFQGHNHLNDLKTIGGIHYCTLPAVVEGKGEKRNAFALLEVYEDFSLRLQGFGETKSYSRKQLARKVKL